jgi:hypothetical protein
MSCINYGDREMFGNRNRKEVVKSIQEFQTAEASNVLVGMWAEGFISDAQLDIVRNGLLGKNPDRVNLVKTEDSDPEVEGEPTDFTP